MLRKWIDLGYFKLAGEMCRRAKSHRTRQPVLFEHPTKENGANIVVLDGIRVLWQFKGPGLYENMWEKWKLCNYS